jgi:hypothetical protein
MEKDARTFTRGRIAALCAIIVLGMSCLKVLSGGGGAAGSELASAVHAHREAVRNRHDHGMAVPRGAAAEPRMAIDPALSAERALRRVIDELVEGIVDALPLHPAKAAYDACMKSGEGERCATIIADVIDYALFQSHTLERVMRDDFGVRGLVDEHGRDVVAAVLGNLVATSDSTLERTTALILRSHTLGDGPLPPLPDQAYRGLAARPIPEASLIAEEHRRTAVPSALADEFTRLAEVSDARAQRSAVVALGHGETAEQLHEAVLGLSRSDRLWNDVAMAVSFCGLPCSDTLQFMARTGPPAARVALYEAVTFASDGERPQLVAMARQYAPETIDQSERELQDELLRTALSD